MCQSWWIRIEIWIWAIFGSPVEERFPQQDNKQKVLPQFPCLERPWITWVQKSLNSMFCSTLVSIFGKTVIGFHIWKYFGFHNWKHFGFHIWKYFGFHIWKQTLNPCLQNSSISMLENTLVSVFELALISMLRKTLVSVFGKTLISISGKTLISMYGKAEHICARKSASLVLPALIKLWRGKFRAFAERIPAFYIFYQIQDRQHPSFGKFLLTDWHVCGKVFTKMGYQRPVRNQFL